MIIGITGYKIFARGIVQGVGFRPFIYTQAIANHLTGWVRNTSNGVEIEVNGREPDIQNFFQKFRDALPPLARIDDLEMHPVTPGGYLVFEIIPSLPNPGDFIPISPDISICPDCQRELMDPANRRFRYPFINCTNCGPRFSIIKDIPYDRPQTTMAEFEMCPNCLQEYHNPLNRRFHAQPVACHDCGPQLSFFSPGEKQIFREEALQAARMWIKNGKILAVKGLGGYHLVCDATKPSVVEELRIRKLRVDKPFALMAHDLKSIQRQCIVSDQEADLLLSRQRPIILMDRRSGSNIAQGVAPNQQGLGVMLPYTPLHFLLLEPEDGYPEFLVMTSGNLSEEPIYYQDREALEGLTTLADGFLVHNREIHMSVDDSVYRKMANQPYPIRRARGYAPDGIIMQAATVPVLAGGAELKNTFCLTKDKYAFVSHHIGNLENFETLRSYEQGIKHYETLFRIKPQLFACDLHPDYLSTGYIRDRAEKENLPVLPIQHHHAHLASCLADNDWASDDPVIGVCFDGTGLGCDGAIWGGEFLVGSYLEYQRTYHIAYTPMPGGEAAIKKTARMALAHLWEANIEWDNRLPPFQATPEDERNILRTQLGMKINTPLTSSMGRLFDTAAALIGLRQRINYEGQAAIELEAAADPEEREFYLTTISGEIINPAPLWKSLLKDWFNGVAIPLLAARFHNSIIHLTVDVCCQIKKEKNINIVALSGGVWQNRYLLEGVCNLLKKAGFTVLIHHQVPANDGGISLGQAAIAAFNLR